MQIKIKRFDSPQNVVDMGGYRIGKTGLAVRVMTRPANQPKWEDGVYNPVDEGEARVGCGGAGPCRDPDCRWKGVVMGLLDVCFVAVDLASKVVAKNDMDDADIQTMQATISDITKNNKKLTRANKELNAEKNGINTVPANDKVQKSQAGHAKHLPPKTIAPRG